MIHLLIVTLLITMMTSSRADVEDGISEPCRPEDGMVLCDDVCYSRHHINVTSCNVDCSDDELKCGDSCYPRNMAIECRSNEAVRYLPCHDDEFQCRASKRCIPRYYVKDGTDDCSHWVPENSTTDTSDEDFPLPSCHPHREYRCPTTSQCIPRHMVMNGKKDCSDNSDENIRLDCEPLTEHKCVTSGRCIPRYRVNDAHPDCPDASDENVTRFTCHEQLEFTCGESERCIPRLWIGNNIAECRDGDDENVTELACVDGEFACADRLRCLPIKYRCDGVANCHDDSDEDCIPATMMSCGNNTIPWSIPLSEHVPIEFDDVCNRDVMMAATGHVGLKCKTVYYTADKGSEHATSWRRIVPQIYIRNNISICADRQDRCHDDRGRLLCARCLSGDVIIASGQLCDGVVDCPDLSDECSCGVARSDVTPLCDDVYDRNNATVTTAAKLARVCKIPDGGDVYGEFCHRRRRRSHANSSSTGFCDGVVDYADRVDECSWRCLLQRKADDDVTAYMTLCFPFLSVAVMDGGQTFAFFHLTLDAEGLPRVSSVTEDVSLSLEEVFGVDHNDFVWELHVHKDLNFLCQYGGVECPWLFYCADGVNWVDLELVCDLVADCPDRSDEHNCSAGTHFYCASGTDLFIGRDRVLDGTADCPDSSDECSGPVIGSASLRLFLWFVGVFGCVSNSLVFVRFLVKVKRSSCISSASYFVTSLLSSLIFCDLLMSIALLLLSHNSSQMLDNFCEHRYTWLMSASCRAIGVVALISTQTAINILVMMTVIRLIVAYKPALTSDLHRPTFFACHVIMYVISACLAAVSFLALPHRHVVGANAFLGNAAADTISVEAMARYYNQTITMTTTAANLSTPEGAFPATFSDWYYNTDEGRRRYPRRAVDAIGNVGYYASSQSCFPYFFTTSAAFSWALIMYDVIAVLGVTVGGVVVYRKMLTAKRETTVGRIKRKTNKRLNVIVAVRLVSTVCVFIFALAYHHRGEENILSGFYLLFFALNPLIEPVVLSGVDRAIRTQSMLIMYLVRKSSGRHFGGGDSDDDDVEMNERAA